MRLTAEEIEKMVGEDEYEVDRIYGENRRWSRSVRSVLLIDGNHYMVNWEQGLTESQPDGFEDQEAIEVIEVEETKTVTETVWKPKEA